MYFVKRQRFTHPTLPTTCGSLSLFPAVLTLKGVGVRCAPEAGVQRHSGTRAGVRPRKRGQATPALRKKLSDRMAAQVGRRRAVKLYRTVTTIDLSQKAETVEEKRGGR